MVVAEADICVPRVRALTLNMASLPRPAMCDFNNYGCTTVIVYRHAIREPHL